MKAIDTALYHRVLLPEHAKAGRHPTLIMLHGRGADEEDLLGLAPYLDDRFLILSPRAPNPFPSGGGFTWYDVGSLGVPDAATFAASYGSLDRFVADAIAGYPVDAANVFLFGFSMGSVMSYALALTKPRLFRGVVANSGYIPEGTSLELQWKSLAGLEFLVTHGTEDPIIPVEMARHAKELFDHSTAAVTYREYPMGHQISEESLADVNGWLTQRLPGRQETLRASE